MENTNYKIGVITNVCGQVMRDLKNTAAEHGVVFDQISYSHIPLTGFTDSDLIKHICSYDVLYYRTGMRDTVIHHLAKILQEKGIPLINGGSKHHDGHRKIQQALIAGQYNIPHPKSYLIRNFKYEEAAKVLGPSFVIKPDNGSKGGEVELINSAVELQEFKKNKKKSLYVYQELISNAQEYRVYTLGDKGVASYKKVAGEGDFRANLHTGGSMIQTEAEVSDQLLEFGGHVASCFGADISGVDILMKDGKCFLLEINWQPGWEHLDELTGTNLSVKTLEYILKRAHQSASK